MKKTSMVLATLVSATLALPAVAGPDWTVVRAAEAHRAQQPPHPATNGQPVAEEPLPLDHGPRALSTPWLNVEHEEALLAHAHHAPHTATHS